ncbi:MAG: hypothetical protein LBI06_05115 [Treponema sp.]|nr:hypothetical protein [Treponema sp.]
MFDNFIQRSEMLLKITSFSGLMLLLLFGGLCVGAYTASGGAAQRGAEKESPFHRMLREYDFKYRRISQAESSAVQRQELERLDSDLDQLEKKTEGVESWLSVLKRRRQLAARDSHYEQSYQRSSRRATLAFPYSEPIAVVAAAALVHNVAITEETEAKLRNSLPLLASPRFVPMRFSLHVLLGDLRNPQRAMANMTDIAGLTPAQLFDPATSKVPPQVTVAPLVQAVAVNLAIMKILAGNLSAAAAAADIQTALVTFPSPALTRLAAEYFFDFGDLIRSAELFSMLPDELALSQQADALWLAGYIENARNIWTMLASPEQDGSSTPQSRAALRNRALYNLALTAKTREEATVLFERLLREQSDVSDPGYRYGLIRFSRLQEPQKALALLEAGKDSADMLVDLEILKRRTEIEETARVIAETWLLLDRYPGTEDLYQWGAWYFILQRNYTESAILLRAAARHNFSGQWMNIHEALQQLHEGYVDAAEETLKAIPPKDANWTIAANLGRILESRRAPTQALESYERAAAAVMEKDQTLASRIQVRIARCLKTLGKIEESRRVLNYALNLNPDNLNARLELARLESN